MIFLKKVVPKGLRKDTFVYVSGVVGVFPTSLVRICVPTLTTLMRSHVKEGGKSPTRYMNILKHVQSMSQNSKNKAIRLCCQRAVVKKQQIRKLQQLKERLKKEPALAAFSEGRGGLTSHPGQHFCSCSMPAVLHSLAYSRGEASRKQDCHVPGSCLVAPPSLRFPPLAKGQPGGPGSRGAMITARCF